MSSKGGKGFDAFDQSVLKQIEQVMFEWNIQLDNVAIKLLNTRIHNQASKICLSY